MDERHRKVPREAWLAWEESYKVSYPEYVATQREKEAAVYAVKAALQRSSRSLAAAESASNPVLRRSLEYVRGHLSEPMTAWPTLAEPGQPQPARPSPHLVLRARVLGRSPYQFVKETAPRLDRARELLVDGD